MHVTNRRSVATRISFTELRREPVEFQRSLGYVHTLAEIWQQPGLWVETARRVAAVPELFNGSKAILLTGSGSSYFVGKCIESALQASTGMPVSVVESGELLMLGASALPPVRPLLIVSFARSGDSPESFGLIEQLLATEPGISHLVITCNPHGRLARSWGDGADPRVRVLVLDERSCDRSLVMTSSFTCMAVAGLGLAAEPVSYLAAVQALADGVTDLLASGLAPVEEFPVESFQRMIAVGSGALYGAALESSLKILEMTDGRVLSRAETFLGLRHGPMCALQNRSLLFAGLSSHPVRRAYQLDLLRDVDRKRLGGRKVIVGGQVPSEVIRPGDLAIQMPGLMGLGDEWVAIAMVVASQLLGFLRCQAEGLRPDHPVAGESITRVVGAFPLHGID